MRTICMLGLLTAGTTAMASELPAEPPASIVHARVEIARESSPAEALKAALRDQGASWIGWSVPAVPSTGEICCFGSHFRQASCSLSDKDWSWGTNDAKGSSGSPAEIFVLVESERGQVAGVRVVSPTCEVDGADRRLRWLGAVDPADSLAALGKLVAEGSRDRVAEPALAAIAYHAGSAPDAFLERRALDRALDDESRQQALFWAGNLRGEPGYRLLDRILSAEPDPDVREHALFALTQSSTAPAIERIKRAGIEDRAGSVRSQAMFWLAQAHASGAGEWIVGRLDAERDREVREQAVFALSQLPDGTDWLLQLLRSKREPEVVRQALFWLGQSEDPRALEEIEKILER